MSLDLIRPDAPWRDTLSRRMADAQVYLAGSVNDQSMPALIQEVSDRVGKGARSVLLAISSIGGNVYWGVTGYNFLRGLGVEIITHNMGQVDSIAAVLYCAGDRRYSVSQGRFLIHGVTWTFAATNPTLTEKNLIDTRAALTRDRDTIGAILSERTGTPLEDVRAKMLEETVLTAPEAAEYGLVQEIKDDVFDPGQEIVRIIHT